MDRSFKGIWIPKEIWLNEKLTVIEKIFLVEIDSLDGRNGCFASNAHFADFFSISKGRCTQIIKSLEEKKYIKITLIREGKQIKKRVIRVFNKLNRVVNKLNYPSENIKSPYLENDEGSNTSNSNTKESNTERVSHAQYHELISDEFKPSDTTIFHLKRNGHKPLNPEELQIFICHYQGDGTMKSNWDAVYRKWVVQQRTIFDKQRRNQEREYTLDELGQSFINGE